MINYPKGLAYSSRTPKDNELWSDCVILWCSSKKAYKTKTWLDGRDLRIKAGYLS